MARLNIVCVGANIESEVALRGLIDAGIAVSALVTLPAGQSRGVSDYVDLHDLCAANGIATIDTRDINSPDTLQAIAATEPDYIFTLGWNRLFRAELLNLPRHFVIGSHPSLLPEGRGRAPVPWTILEGIRHSGVSFFVMTEKADDGKLLHQIPFDVPERAYACDVYRLVADALREGFIALYRKAQQGKPDGIAGAERRPSYRSKRTPDDGHIDFNQSAQHIDRLIRAVSYPYPGAFTFCGTTKLTVWKCSPYAGETRYVASPGQVLARRDGALLVQTATEPLWLEDMTSDGDLDVGSIRLDQRLAYNCELEIYRLKQEIDRLKRNQHD